MMHYLKHEIGLTLFCFTDADLLIPAYTGWQLTLSTNNVYAYVV